MICSSGEGFLGRGGLIGGVPFGAVRVGHWSGSMGRYAVVFFKKVDLAAHPPLFVSVGIFFHSVMVAWGEKG